MGIIDKLVKWARIKSPWVLHLNSGGCNGCDIEILDTLTPRYDLERFGVLLKGSPRHADVLLCSGPITKQTSKRFLRIYNQTPDPKFVVGIGACTMSGGVFRECYNVSGGLDGVIPVDAYIPGCPPKPEAIIHGVAALLGKLQSS
jgi:NADH-quinone oxidoreductase B subunit